MYIEYHIKFVSNPNYATEGVVMRRSLPAIFLAAVFASSSLYGTGAANAVECVKVVGTEPGVPNLTMDPAFQNINDDSIKRQ